jgi:hypothetical protein
MYKRDTGIDGLYIAFPYLIFQPPSKGVKPRIAPILLWPIKITAGVGRRGVVTIGFDREREEVRLSPALRGFLGPDDASKWQIAADEVLLGAARTSDITDAFGVLAPPRTRSLTALPSAATSVSNGRGEVACSAAVLHLEFMGQAVVEELRQLRAIPPMGTALESCFRIQGTGEPLSSPPLHDVPEIERFRTVESDPSQEAAVLMARQAPGLLVEGPPGTGKSQTIVNIISDTIGREKSLLLVCQKQAALEVVHKRLVAKGLRNRLIMVTDVNKDRRQIIESIREQLEELRGYDLNLM